MTYGLWQYHGGTNFGRTAGGPFITTSYDYDAPLDEYGKKKKKTHLFCVWCYWTLDVFSISTTLACTKLWDLDSWSKNYRGHDYVSGIYNLHLTTTPYTGLMRQPKYGHLKQLHEAIKLCEYALVSSDPTVTSLGTYQQVSTQHFLISVTILFW